MHEMRLRGFNAINLHGEAVGQAGGKTLQQVRQEGKRGRMSAMNEEEAAGQAEGEKRRQVIQEERRH
eukprot:360078-Chlamydomonas_euryale.AAC.9